MTSWLIVGMAAVSGAVMSVLVIVWAGPAPDRPRPARRRRARMAHAAHSSRSRGRLTSGVTATTVDPIAQPATQEIPPATTQTLPAAPMPPAEPSEHPAWGQLASPRPWASSGPLGPDDDPAINTALATLIQRQRDGLDPA